MYTAVPTWRCGLDILRIDTQALGCPVEVGGDLCLVRVIGLGEHLYLCAVILADGATAAAVLVAEVHQRHVLVVRKRHDHTRWNTKSWTSS